MRRRASSTVLSAFSRTLQDIPEDEQTFIKATELGDLGTIRFALEASDEQTAGRLINCIDVKDRTILEIATENEHLEIVEFIIDHWGRMLSYESLNECVMLAISKGYIRILSNLLKHPVYQRNRGTLNRLGTITNYYQRINNSKFDQDVTPLMLAAHCNEVDIIRIFLERGETIKQPHVPSCQCNYCKNRRKFDPLKHSKSAIHTYRALGSPAYISLTSNDPILTAFLLSEELSQLARTEKEFKKEYRELSQQCKKYTSDLLDMCQNSKEVALILNQEATSMEEGLNELRPHLVDGRPDQPETYQGSTLQRLKLAVRYNQKQFVSHPHCQHHLATIWYDSFPGWRQLAFPVKIFIPLVLYITCPVWAFIYWIAPTSRIGRVVSTPLVKFTTQTVAYFCFLAALFLQSVFAEADQALLVDCDASIHVNDSIYRAACDRIFCPADNKSCYGGCDYSHITSGCRYDLRQTGINLVDIFILILLAGMFWGEVKQIWMEGWSRYLASGWNWIDIFMLNLYIGSYCAKVFTHIKNASAIEHFNTNTTFCVDVEDNIQVALDHYYFLRKEREDWRSFDPIFVSEALFAFANVLSFSRLSYILPINEFLGPLQISLGRMIGDIVRFGAVFSVVFLAFFCSFLNLYWSLGEESNFGTFFATLLTLFWSLFGMADQTDPNIKEEFKSRGNDYGFTSGVGTVMFAFYHIVMSLVMLNMLIAMMSNSFQEIENEEDVEWKFARAKLWMSYFEKGATIPIPFNIVPSPKSFWRIYQWIAKPIEKHFCRRRAEHTRKPNFHLKETRNEALDIVTNNDITRVERRSHQNMMKAIVRRYLFQLQRSKENDEVNEGELDEIKNDISSLRFELLEMLTSDVDGGSKSPTPQNGTVKGASKFPSHKSADKMGPTKPSPKSGLQNTVRLSRVSPGLLAEGDKEKLENIEKKVETLTDEFASMKIEILKALGVGSRKSVKFGDVNDE